MNIYIMTINNKAGAIRRFCVALFAGSANSIS